VYPGTSPRDAQDREDAECAIGFEAARLAAGKNPSSGSIRLPLLYLRQTEAQRKKVLSKVHVRLNKRLAAARMTWPFLRQVVLKHQGLKTAPLTIAALAEKYRTDAAESRPGNVQGRALRPSYEVLHLAIGLELLLEMGLGRNSSSSSEEVVKALLSEADSSGGALGRMRYEFLLKPDLPVGLVELSEIAARLMAQAPKLREATKKLIRFTAS
jgi:hypothetical protein